MFTTIIIVLGLVGLVGTLKAMTKSEREVALKGAANCTKIAVSYAVIAGKETGKMAFQAGQAVGNDISLNHQESLTTINDFNNKMGQVGAAHTGKQAAMRHLDAVGVVDANKYLKSRNEELVAKLKAARLARGEVEETPVAN